MEATLLMKAEELSDRKKWLAMRKNGIGGSEAAHIVGLAFQNNLYGLWADKTGLYEPEDLSNVEVVHFGQVNEQTVANEFELRTGKKVRKCGLYQSKEHPFMLASIDRLVVGENAGLECKTTSSWLSEFWDEDKIPDAYFVQCLHYMAACGFDRYYIACLIGGNHFVWKCIERKDVEEDIKALVEEEEKFWKDHVLAKIPPDVNGSVACTRVLNRKYSELNNDKKVIMDNNMEQLCIDIIDLKAQLKEIKDTLALKENQVRELMEDNEEATSDDYRVTFKFQKANKSFDYDTFNQEHPDIDINVYYHQAVNRVLRITKPKKKNKED